MDDLDTATPRTNKRKRQQIQVHQCQRAVAINKFEILNIEQVVSGSKMEVSHKGPVKGHQRRQSIGKSMPISALVLSSKPQSGSFLERIEDKPKHLPGISISSSNDVEYFNDEARLREMQQNFDINDFRDKLKVAEALSQMSMLTSPAAKRRLAARKIEMDSCNQCFADDNNSRVGFKPFNDEDGYVPPRELLMYLVR